MLLRPTRAVISSKSARPSSPLALLVALLLLLLPLTLGTRATAAAGTASFLPRHAHAKHAPPPPSQSLEGMGGPSVTPSHGHHHDAPGASPSGKPVGAAMRAKAAAEQQQQQVKDGEEELSPRRDAATSTTCSTDAEASGGSSSRASSSGAGGSVVRKREDYISWDDYFMGVAFLSAMRSKDPSTQVGACLVDGENKIVGIGYNGFPRGCSDDALPWARSAGPTSSGGSGFLDTKYAYVCHAEMNAILNRNIAPLHGCRMYVALFPCNECAKLIIQSGVKDVVFLSDKYHDDEIMVASRRLFDLAGVRYRQHVPKMPHLTIDFTKA